MKFALALFTLTGFNFTLWAFLSVLRFFFEKIPESIQSSFKKAKHVHRIQSRLFTTLILLIIIGAEFIFIVSFVRDQFPGAIYTIPATFTFLVREEAIRLSVIALIFGFLGYMISRIVNRSAIIDHLTSWLVIAAGTFILLPTSMMSRFLDQPIKAIAVALMSIVAVVIGGSIASLVRRHVISRANDHEIRHDQVVPSDVASITAAHNEELTIGKTIESLARVLPRENIYVASDASTDRTVEIVNSLGANAVNIEPNRGKAGALQYGIDHFDLINRYKAVLIIDADSEVNEEYMKKALPLFNDDQVAAVAGHATTKWHSHIWPKRSMFFPAYRVRFYRVLQAVMRYGQTWKYANVSPIVPGFCSIYRTTVLPHINITAPGLIIEDFNMTFELHHKKLGRIAYDPGVKGITDDPHSLRDYMKQIKRWNLGFWQTVRRHGFWPSIFWLANGLLIAEMIFFGIFSVLIPLTLIWFIATGFAPLTIFSAYTVTFLDVILGVLLVDYLVTAVVALYEKKPVMFLYGFGFPFVRYIDALMFLYALPLAFIAKSSGRWVSPRRIANANR